MLKHILKMGRSPSKGRETFAQKARGIPACCKPGIDLLGGVANKFSNNVKLLTNLTLRNTVIRVYTLSWIDPFPTPSSNFLLWVPGISLLLDFISCLGFCWFLCFCFFLKKNNPSLFNASNRQMCAYGHPVGMDNLPMAALPEERWLCLPLIEAINWQSIAS